MIILFGPCNGEFSFVLITVNTKIQVLDEMVTEQAISGPAENTWSTFIS